MGKLFDQPIKDAHIILETADDGNIDLRVSYSLAKLEAPISALAVKVIGKIPFLKNYVGMVPAAISRAFASANLKSAARDVTPEPAAEAAGAEAAAPAAESAKAPAPQPDPQPVAAHQAEPVEAVHQA